MGTDTKTVQQQSSLKVTPVSSGKRKMKKSKKSKHSKRERSSSSSSSSHASTERGRHSTSTKRTNINNSFERSSRDKTKLSSTAELRNNDKKTPNKNKKQSNRSSESSYERNNDRTKSRSRSRSRSRSSDRSSSYHHHQKSNRRFNSNIQNIYSPMSNFNPNTTRRYPSASTVHTRGGRMPSYNPSRSLRGGYRPPQPNFRGHNGPMNNATYFNNVHNMANMIENMSSLIHQKSGTNPNNHFHQQFQNNYKKLKAGEKISNLYQASFPVNRVPRDMRLNFRLLGRNIFTASDEQPTTTTEKRSKPHQRHSSSDSEDERREEEKEATAAAIAAGNSNQLPTLKNSNEKKNNRNRTSSSTPDSHNSSNLSSLIAGMMQGENSELMANTLADAAVVVNNKRERTKKHLEKKVQKFKNYARIQQAQTVGSGVTGAANPEEDEKKIYGLARRLQMKTIGLHEDYELQGMKRSDDSNPDSDASERRRRSSSSNSHHSKDKDAGSDISSSFQRQRKLKKKNSSSQLIGSSDGEHQTDGNNSDGSMLNLNESLKPIGYYIKDRERMLHEMFRCVRGHRLQAILPNGLKTRSLDEIKAKCLDQLDVLSKKRIRAILYAQSMTSSSGTEDSTDEDERDLFTLYPKLKSPVDATSTTTPADDNNNKKSLPNSKFRPVQMHITENPSSSTMIPNNLSTPVIIRGDEDVHDYYEGFKTIKKLTNLRRNDLDDDLTLFPGQNGKFLQSIGTNLPKFEFKPIASLTHNRQAHFNARRVANREQQENDIHQEIDDLLNIDDFILPNGERPLSSAELSTREQRQYGLPPKILCKIPIGPPKKGSLGDLLKKQSNSRSPSPIISERRRHRQRSSSSERSSRHSSTEKLNDDGDEDMSDLSKLLDLNEEDELLLLQIEVEQEERNIRRQVKQKHKEKKKKKQIIIIQQCLNDLIEKTLLQQENTINLKRSCNNMMNLSKKIKIEDTI